MDRNDVAWLACIFLAAIWLLSGDYAASSAFVAAALVLAGLEKRP